MTTLRLVERQCYHLSCDAGWSSSVARRAHNPKVAGSNPAPATKKPLDLTSGGFLLPALVLVGRQRVHAA